MDVVVHEVVIANLMLVVSYQSSYGRSVGLTESVVELRESGVEPNVLVSCSKRTTDSRTESRLSSWLLAGF